MLAQILHDLYVPQELLDGLPEDQRQLLFCKMREEQVRRYHEREEDEAAARKSHTNKRKKKKKHVTFRLANDGDAWCQIVGETETSPEYSDTPLNTKINNENIPINHQNQSRALGDANYILSKNNGSNHKTQQHEQKQIEEISNNIQEARRIFERLETETQQLVLNQESQDTQQQSHSSQIPANDVVDEIFYREITERANKADQERREIARRARDHFQRNALQLNVCFDTNNRTTLSLRPPPLNSSNTNNRESKNEKKIHIELVGKKPPLASSSSVNDLKEATVQLPVTIVEHHRPQLVLPLTRDDIRQWFCTSEIPYSTFRSSSGQIYPWFHGIISRSMAEHLLSSKAVGTYLIRINEKIFGYALSYRASDHCRHLLIEVLSSTKCDSNRKSEQEHAYRFLGGAKYELFTHLNQLIEKYSNTPIRPNSTDVLRYPCGQADPRHPDYADLLLESTPNESLYISLETTTSSPRSTTHL